MPQYIHDNADDEQSHADFINAYLQARGAQPINLDKFRTVPGSKARGAADIRRLTNLMELTVDTSYWTRYRSDSQNPDLGDTLPQAVPGLAAGKFPAIPRTNDDLRPRKHLQAIANTAAFHFGMIEQGGTSLYASLAQRVSDPEVLRILLKHRPDRDDALPNLAGQGEQRAAAHRPDERSRVPRPERDGELTQTNLIMPEPTVFLDRKFPICSIIRPTQTVGAAVGAVKGLAASGLFTGQSQEFFTAATALAQAADAATRG
jgi:hypothetical protein